MAPGAFPGGVVALSTGYPASLEEFSQRVLSHRRGRTLVSVLGWAPLLALYVLTHTKYLRPFVPESKGMAVVVLIVLPFSWMLGVVLAYRRLGPAMHGLRCPQCASPLVDETARQVAEAGTCPACGAALLRDVRPQSSGEA